MVNTAIPLWKNKYRVRVPVIALRSDEDIATYGTFVNYGENISKQVHTNTVVCMLSIVEIANVYKDGYVVNELSNKSIVHIYQCIMNHLNAWDNHTNNSLNRKKPPTDDLKLLYEVATNLFEKNRGLFAKSINEYKLESFGSLPGAPVNLFGSDEGVKGRDLSVPTFDTMMLKKFTPKRDDDKNKASIIDFEVLARKYT